MLILLSVYPQFEPEVEEEKPEKTEPEAMPENIVAVEPEPSEPVIKDTADSSTMKYFT